jgi:uncharacterized OB-fold protein
VTGALAVALPADAVHIAVNPVTEPFWEAARNGRLVAPRCSDCGTYRLPPTPFCPTCTSKRVTWEELSGSATVFSFAVVHGYPGIEDILLVPAVLDVEGAPGARLVSPLVDVDPAAVHIGMPVQVAFVPIADGWQLPVFRPADPPAGASR